MINKVNLDILLKNNTGNKAKSVLLEGFVVRLEAYLKIFSALRQGVHQKHFQNFLLIGQRGAGKTTLLYRLKYGIEDGGEKFKHIIPVMFNEEQYNLTELLNLWESVAEHLAEHSDFSTLHDELQIAIWERKIDQEAAFDLLQKALKNAGKRIILLIENIDVFFKKIGFEEQRAMEKMLSNCESVSLIATSTTYFEGINIKGSFRDFFEITQLDGLTHDESIKLLLKLGELTNESERIHQIILRNPKRIESLRRLTGGNPRTMSYLFQIFLDNGNGKAILDLYKLLDDLTFLYKAELDQLSPQQQKVIDIIARHWDAISVKELANGTKLESKYISSVLNILEKNQTIEVVATKTKNNLYRIKDRFLNIWYLMRFGKKRDKENIVWLVRFYDAWCSKTELSDRIATHINNLKDGQYDSLAALDLGNTFLSCINVSPDLKYDLWRTTKSYLPKDMIKELKVSEEILYNSIKNLVRKKNYDKAVDALNDIEVKDLHYYTFSYWVYYKKGDIKTAVESLERVFEIKQDGTTAFTIGSIYERKLHLTDLAVKYYKIALEKGNYSAAYRLGQINFYSLSDLEQSINYHRLAIENGISDSIESLATIFVNSENYSEAEELYQLSYEKGNYSALNEMAQIKQKIGKADEAILLLNQAIEHGDEDALINLGKIYVTPDFNDLNAAKALFLRAIDKGIPQAYYNMGKLLISKEKNEKEGIQYLNTGIKNHDSESAHYLAHYYEHRNKYEKAEKLFVKAFELGKSSALLCLADSAFEAARHDKRDFIIGLFDKYMLSVGNDSAAVSIEYARVLLWANRYEESFSCIRDAQSQIVRIFSDSDEDYKQYLISELTNYLVLSIAKGQMEMAQELFKLETVDYKQILKPVYYAMMNFMTDDYPNEHLKPGSELKETINEIIMDIEKKRVNYGNR